MNAEFPNCSTAGGLPGLAKENWCRASRKSEILPTLDWHQGSHCSESGSTLNGSDRWNCSQGRLPDRNRSFLSLYVLREVRTISPSLISAHSPGSCEIFLSRWSFRSTSRRKKRRRERFPLSARSFLSFAGKPRSVFVTRNLHVQSIVIHRSSLDTMNVFEQSEK